MNVKLVDIASLHFGLYAKPKTTGEVCYIQTKHFNEEYQLTESIDTLLTPNKKNTSHLLLNGDVLFVGKGMRNFAWTYTTEIGEAIASSIFYVIRVDQTKVLPEFLTTLFNLNQTQAYFQSLGAGSSIPSIRKSELEAFTFDLPTIETQMKVVTLKDLHLKSKQLTQQILEEKQKIYQTAINKLILEKP